MSYPKQLFTRNSKTVISLDFNRHDTCASICSYCYVANTERMYKAYLPKITRNAVLAKTSPEEFAEKLNMEYWKLRKSKSRKMQVLSKLPVRLYGAGDYIPEHYDFISKLSFKTYIISKNLTRSDYKDELIKIISLDTVTKVILSFDMSNINLYTACAHMFGLDKIGFAFTGLPDEFAKVLKQYPKFNIFFNISNKQLEKEKSRSFKEQCPCDSGGLKLENSCTKCNKCWRSSVSKEFLKR